MLQSKYICCYAIRSLTIKISRIPTCETFFLYNHVLKNVLKPLLNTRIFEIMVFASQRMDPEISFSR